MFSYLLFPTVMLFVNNAIGCLNNYRDDVGNEWNDRGAWKTNSILKASFNYQLKDWRIEMEFNEPLQRDMKSWNTDGFIGSKGKSKVTLTPKHWNKVISSHFQMSYFVTFKNKQNGNYLKCAQFCGQRTDTNQEVCRAIQTTTTTTTKTPAPETTTTEKQPTKTTTTKRPTTTTTTTTTKKQPTTTTTTKRPTITTKTTERSCSSKYDYTEVLRKSLLFYEAQRAGDLPPDQQVTWRHDSFLDDGSSVGLDLTGGYFDAGDYVKFGFPMASTITNLAWGMLEFKQGYIAAGQFDHGLAAIKWGTDYFIKCHPSSDQFYGQVGNGGEDHAKWDRPENMPGKRPAYYISDGKPGSDLAAETAAALAATAMVFQANRNLMYSLECLTHAKQLYSMAMKYRGNYHDSIPEAARFYKSWSGYKDELAWASLWLYRATGDVTYKDNFMNEFDNQAMNESPEEFSWDNKWNGVKVLAQKIQINGNADYLGKFKNLLQKPKKTPKGLFYVQKWGALRHAANLAFLARVASTIEDADFYNEFAKGQIDYMLGDSGRSYVVGFGNNPPQKPHHRSSSCPETGPCGWDQFNSQSPNPQVLYGALVGGPDQNDGYTDHRGDYIKNEVACDYNAGFQSALAGLLQVEVDKGCLSR